MLIEAIPLNERFSKEKISSMGIDWSEANETNEALDELSNSRVESIHVAGILRKSKLAWKFSVHRQALTYRLVDLGESAIREWSSGHLLSPIVLARAFLETSALIHSIVSRASKALEAHDISALDALIMQETFGAKIPERIDELGYAATNVLTALDHMSKDIEFIRSFYEQISEVAHPNSFGTSQFYGTTNTKNGTVTFSRSKRDPTHVFDTINLALLGAKWSVWKLGTWDSMIVKIAELQTGIDKGEPT